jgi:hypothetical protein
MGEGCPCRDWDVWTARTQNSADSTLSSKIHGGPLTSRDLRRTKSTTRKNSGLSKSQSHSIANSSEIAQERTKTKKEKQNEMSSKGVSRIWILCTPEFKEFNM